VKKPKIKLTTSSTPKTTNGATPKAAAPAPAADAKPSKQKPKKAVEKKVEPKLTPQERHARKEVCGLSLAERSDRSEWFADKLNRRRSSIFDTDSSVVSSPEIRSPRTAT
jgi:hypothetical protein